jgi:hypothetical protein
MYRRAAQISTAVIVLATFTIAGCGGGRQQSQQQGSAGNTSELTTTEQAQLVEDTTVTESTVAEDTSTESVSVGGFTHKSPSGGDTTIPEITTQREDVQKYEEQVRPIIWDTVGNVSDLVQSDVGLVSTSETDHLTFDVPITALDEARKNARDGLERLRNTNPPEDLQPINQSLITAYERVLPAYDEITSAAESEEPEFMSEAVSKNLPRIESFSEETHLVLEDVERAADSQ